MKRVKSIFILCNIIFIIISCTRTTHLIKNSPHSKSIEEFNYLGNKKNGYLEFISEKSIAIKWIKLQDDTLKYIPLNSDTVKIIGINQVKFVYFNDHFVGAADGFIFGFFGGLIPGLLFYDPDVHESGLIAFVTGIGGSAIGTMFGMIKGSKLKYIMYSEELSNSSNK